MDNTSNNMENSLDNFFNIGIDQEARQYLKTAAYWARIVAILGFVGVGIALMQIGVTGSRSGLLAASGAGMTSLVGIVVSVIMNIFLIRFSGSMSAGLSNMNQEEFDKGVNQLRNYFKAFGIIMIIIIALCILIFLFYIVFALTRL